jgi:uncharacterized protein YyaL (SSP411 family)
MPDNRLVHEKSPYLQQHAHNPVDWYPWGAEAFDKARREDKPIFLSVGYSTCHWCHVMEHESFENDDVAEVLNRNFVPIKVDREERPDVDRIYMTFVQASTGSGGWPMSVFLTPELKPFFGGTYFPPDNRYGRPGFKAILEHLASAWRRERDKIDQSSAAVIRQLQEREEASPTYRHALDAGILDSAFHYFRRTYDVKNGGFGDAPKFPRPAVLNLLLRYHYRTRNEEAHDMSLHTLRAMAAGGMYDQLGGGFHRYSVDAIWLVPHFEKMLYDQAQLAISYVEAYQIVREPLYANIAHGIFEYVLRDMTHPEGGFFSAEDADSIIDPGNPKVKGEGAFYIWSWDEIQQILGAPDTEVFCDHYGVARNGNVVNDPHGEFTGKNILFVKRAPDDAAAPVLERARAKLLEARNHRPRPDRDDKILTSWNSLMISAFAKGAQVLDDKGYATAAVRAAEFIERNMLNRSEHTLLRRYRDGDAAIPGFLDDYAFFVQALLDLYETDFDPRRIELAIAVTRKMCDLFEDREHGAFFTTAAGDDSLVLRMKDDYDGAEPAGNSIALLNLLRLAEITGSSEFRDAADRTLTALSSRIASQPVAVPQMLVALEYSLAARKQVILAGYTNDGLTQEFLRKLRGRFEPHTVTLLVDGGAAREKLASFVPAIGEMKELDGRPTAYVCQNYTCQLPTHDVSKFDELLQ